MTSHECCIDPSHEMKTALISAAIRAPSGDNCQPWAFRCVGNEIHIYSLPERSKSFFDYQQVGTLLSVGAVIENIRVQAGQYDIDVAVDYVGGYGYEKPTGIVRLNHMAGKSQPCDSVVDSMLKRTVNRRPFLPCAPSAKVLKSLAGDTVEGTAITIIHHRSEISKWAHTVYLADLIRFTHPEIHHELFSKILLNRSEVERKRLGLEYNRLGLGPLASLVLRWLRPWDRMARLSNWGVHKLLAGQSKLLTKATGALVLVTIPEDTKEGWIRSGEQVERLWIRAQHLGLCVHPVTVALYLDRRYRNEGTTNFLPCHTPILEELNQNLSDLTSRKVGAMLFRIGYGVRMRTPAVRMSIDSFILPEE
jgi:hypothetical protein